MYNRFHYSLLNASIITVHLIQVDLKRIRLVMFYIVVIVNKSQHCFGPSLNTFQLPPVCGSEPRCPLVPSEDVNLLKWVTNKYFLFVSKGLIISQAIDSQTGVNTVFVVDYFQPRIDTLLVYLQCENGVCGINSI